MKVIYKLLKLPVKAVNNFFNKIGLTEKEKMGFGPCGTGKSDLNNPTCWISSMCPDILQSRPHTAGMCDKIIVRELTIIRSEENGIQNQPHSSASVICAESEDTEFCGSFCFMCIGPGITDITNHDNSLL